MLAGRTDGIFGCLITNVANEDVLAPLRMFLEDQIGMVGHLAHLHDETEYVGVIVQHNTARDICIKLSGSILHDA
jgi:hypothetical protein